jgi:phosphoglycolate phosphatase-like HAD superfamily hydrolase
MATGMEMMLMSAVKALGLDPAKITEIANSVGDGINRIVQSLERIEAQNTRIENKLDELLADKREASASGANIRALPHMNGVDNADV